MVDAPEKIRVAQDSDGFWTCREAISGSQEYTRSDLVAELAAENERLKHDQTAYKSTIDHLRKRAEDAEALSNTGAVKVSLEDCLSVVDRLENEWRANGWEDEATAACDIAAALYALTPHPRATNTVEDHGAANVSDKPEGQQKPVAYRVHAPEDEYYGVGPDRLQFHPLAQYDLDNGYRQTPLYTRPSEQAVTEERLFNVLRNNSWDLRCFDIPTGQGDADIGWRVIGHYMSKPYERTIAEIYHDDPRAALKAAMEAGHD